jgi:hypothetical protein
MSKVFLVSANVMLAICLIEGLLVLGMLCSPLFLEGWLVVLVCVFWTGLYSLWVRNVTITDETHYSRPLKVLVEFFYLGIAAGVVSAIFFVYLGADLLTKISAGLAVLMTGHAYGKIIDSLKNVNGVGSTHYTQ